MKYKYIGTDERVFPSLGVVVNSGDEFDAPDNFSAPDCVPSSGVKAFPKPTTPSTETKKQESE
jgi:hypothetical protein